MKKKADLLIYFLFISNLLLAAQNHDDLFKTILLSPDNKPFSINRSVYFFEDTIGNLSFEDISKPEFSEKFTLSTKESMNFGYTHSTYWVKFHLQNLHPQFDDWLLEIDNHNLDSIDFFYIDKENQWEIKPFGDMYPFQQREWPTRTFIIPLQLPDTVTNTYYVRIKGIGVMLFPMIIHREKSFQKNYLQAEIYYGIFFGIMFLLIINNIFIYFSLRDISYLNYILLILSTTVFTAFTSGHLFQYVLNNSMFLNNRLLPSIIVLCAFCMINFTRSFLNIKKDYAKLDKVLIYYMIFELMLIFLLFSTNINYNFRIKVATYTAQLAILISLLSGILSLLKGNKSARLFILAFTLFLLGGIAVSFIVVGIYGHNIISEHGMEIGQMLNGIILSLALVNNYRIDKTEKEKAQEEIINMRQKANEILEQTVKDRTVEISEKNEELNQRNDELALQRDEIEAQRDELATTLENLNRTQKQLIESKKMASLGVLVAGVAHEINTPVGIGVTAVTNLIEETRRMANLYSKGEISRARFKDYLNTTNETAGLIQKNLERTANLVQSFKQVSIDQSTEEHRDFFLKAYLKDLMSSLKPKLKGKNVEINIDCDEHLKLNSYPGSFAQIFSNLVLNSLIHGFMNKAKGIIFIVIRKINKELEIEYRDNGRGIDPDILPMIFEPFKTTDQSKGIGLGLHIVYNNVSQRLNGTIKIESEPGEGVKFSIKIPIPTV